MNSNLKKFLDGVADVADKAFNSKVWGLWIMPVFLIIMQLISDEIRYDRSMLLPLLTLHLVMVTFIANVESSYSDVYKNFAEKFRNHAEVFKAEAAEYKQIAETAVSLNQKILSKASYEEVSEKHEH